MLQWRLLRTSCSTIFFFLAFSLLFLAALLSLLCSPRNQSIHIRPPAQQSIPTRCRLDPPLPRGPVAYRPERRRRRGRCVATRARHRTPVRRFADICAACLGTECVSCRGRPRHLSSLFFVSSSSWARSVASATVLQQRLLYNSWRPCAPQPKPSRSIHPPRNRSSPEDKAIHLDTR